MNAAIPESLQKDIRALAESFKTGMNDQLMSLVLYGGLVKNDLVKDRDLVNLMVVVKEINTRVLGQVAEVMAKSPRRGQCRLLTLSVQDLKSSMDVFPIKFLDMQQDYEVLAGDDVVKDLKISRVNLRLRCEQEIKNLMLRLRQEYIARSENEATANRTMLRSYYDFLIAADVLAELKTGKVCRKDDDIIKANEGLGLDMSPFRRIQQIRQGKPIKDAEERRNTYEQLMATVRQAAVMADEL